MRFNVDKFVYKSVYKMWITLFAQTCPQLSTTNSQRYPQIFCKIKRYFFYKLHKVICQNFKVIHRKSPYQQQQYNSIYIFVGKMS